MHVFIVGRGFRFRFVSFRFVSFPVPAFITCRAIEGLPIGSAKILRVAIVKVRTARDFRTRPQLSLSRSSFANNCTALESWKVGHACALKRPRKSPLLPI